MSLEDHIRGENPNNTKTNDEQSQSNKEVVSESSDNKDAAPTEDTAPAEDVAPADAASEDAPADEKEEESK